MRRLRFVGASIGVLIIIASAGCSSSGTLTTKVSPSQRIATGTTVALSVTATSADSDAKEVASRLRDRLYSKLLSEGIFRSIVREPEPADYRMLVTITGAREVSAGARIMLGAMTGPNIAEASIQVRDGRSNQVLRSFDVVGNSASHPFSSEAGLEDAIREAVEKIIEGIR